MFQASTRAPNSYASIPTSFSTLGSHLWVFSTTMTAASITIGTIEISKAVCGVKKHSAKTGVLAAKTLEYPRTTRLRYLKTPNLEEEFLSNI